MHSNRKLVARERDTGLVYERHRCQRLHGREQLLKSHILGSLCLGRYISVFVLFSNIYWDQRHLLSFKVAIIGHAVLVYTADMQTCFGESKSANREIRKGG